MRTSLAFLVAMTGTILTASLGACGSNGGSGSGGFDSGGEGGHFGDGGKLGQPDTGTLHGGDGSSSAPTMSNITITPANKTITVVGGQTATQAYHVMAVLNGSGAPQDVTSRFAFYVPPPPAGQPNDYLVGTFPPSGGPLFSTRLQTTPTDPPQQGGPVTIQATGLNPGNKKVVATTSLTVKLTAQFVGPITPVDEPEGGLIPDGSVPANAASLFNGPAKPAYAPIIAYPNNGAMLPPNLKFLEVHWVPAAGTTLFQVSFASALATISYVVRCGTLPNGPLVANSCALALDPTGYGYLAQSNAGAGPVTLTVEGTDDTGTGVGTSSSSTIEFAQQPVLGGVYYWNVSATTIMRFDFGGTGLTPEAFLAPGNYGLPNDCVGCHALSPDGSKIVASLNGQNGGQIVYLNNLASAPGPMGVNNTNYLTLAGDANNHIQFASFNPSGDEFVAVYGDGNTTDPNPGAGFDAGAPSWYNLWLHDGNTGLITSAVSLDFEPDHPCWSPDGTMIAVTHVPPQGHNTSQEMFSGGIDVIPVKSGVDGGTLGLGTPVTLIPSLVAGYNRFNPNFAPDSSFLYYTETSGCTAAQQDTAVCDSDISGPNISDTTWAIQPKAGAAAIHLANSAAPGYADMGVTPLDTFPRSTPFETTQGSGKLFWFTVGSVRAPGLRQQPAGSSVQPGQLLWMFAVDPAKILAGQDGSYPGFFLPFQDLTTSNHIAQWTQKIVSSTPAPPPPPLPDAGSAPPPPNVP